MILFDLMASIDPALPLWQSRIVFLYLVFQIIRIGCFRCDESIERELCAEAEAGDEAVEGGFTVDGCPCIDILKKTFLFLASEFIREEVLAFVQCLHIVLDLFILLGASCLRVNIAIVKLFDKTIHGSFSLIFSEKPVRPCRKNVVFSIVLFVFSQVSSTLYDHSVSQLMGDRQLGPRY